MLTHLIKRHLFTLKVSWISCTPWNKVIRNNPHPTKENIMIRQLTVIFFLSFFGTRANSQSVSVNIDGTTYQCSKGGAAQRRLDCYCTNNYTLKCTLDFEGRSSEIGSGSYSYSESKTCNIAASHANKYEKFCTNNYSLVRLNARERRFDSDDSYSNWATCVEVVTQGQP